MANAGKGSMGYVIVGVADKKDDADKLCEIDKKYEAIRYQNFYITGVNYDIDKYGNEDGYYQFIINKIKNIDIDDLYKSYILNNIKFLNYGGKMIFIFKVKGLDKPAMYEKEYYQRFGANIDKAKAEDFMSIISRFQGKG